MFVVPLTKEQLESMEPGQIFAEGLDIDVPGGLHMTGSGDLLRWVAVRGQGIPDWAIYCHWEFFPREEVARIGDKVHHRTHIKKLVPCTADALDMYRD
jgi:hypothetical protein